MSGSSTAGPSGWLGAVGLMAVTATVWIGSPAVLIGVPFALLVLFVPPRKPLALGLAALAFLALISGDTSSGFWYVERGWALLLGSCFLALSLRWPGGRFLSRGLGAVVVAFALMALLLRVRPGDWSVMEWLVRSRMEWALSLVLQSVRLSMGPEAVPADLESQFQLVVAIQGTVFPALLGLASLSALGFAWWMFRRVSRGQGRSLGPLRDFRFNDQLVWILILGVVAFLATSGALERAGANAAFFMGALYLLRGAAVVLFLAGGLSFFGTALLLAGFVLLAPFTMVGAMMIGLGDTWFDLRKRGPLFRPGA